MSPETRFPESFNGSGSATEGELDRPAADAGDGSETTPPAEPPKRARYVRCVLVGLVLLIFFIGGIIGWEAWQSRGSEKAVGVYIAGGGLGYLAIEPAGWNGLEVRRESLELLTMPNVLLAYMYRFPSATISTRVRYRGGNLLVSRTEIMRQGPAKLTQRIEMTLAPSASSPGDWDLVSFHSGAYGRLFSARLSSRDFWKERFEAKSLKEFFGGFAREKMMGWDFPAGRPPIRSFLRRLDDDRVPDYFEARLKELPAPDHLERIRALVRSHPDDPSLALHEIELEVTLGELERAAALWKKWETANPHPEELLEAVSRRVYKVLAMVQLRKSHPGLLHYKDVFSTERQDASRNGLPSSAGGALSLSERLAWQKEFWEADQLMFLGHPVIPPVRGPGGCFWLGDIPNFLEFQIHSKVLCGLAEFYLFEGRREGALELLAGVYRLGQSSNADGVNTSRLIGVAIRAIAASGLEIHLLNACETREEIERFQGILERLNRTPGQESGRQIFDVEFSPLLKHMTHGGMFAVNVEEPTIRHNVSDARFQLLRMAAAAKRRRIETGGYPPSKEEFAALLPDGLPADPCLTTTSLSFKMSGDDFVAYSVGPDKKDDGAALEYDPTNGSRSVGDIRVVIPREREFPFPATPVRARNAAELLEQFPNGLPRDPFASTRGRPLSIVDSTTTRPLLVFSFGPDGDERDYLHFRKLSSRSAPTSGTHVSHGRRLQEVFLWNLPPGVSQPPPVPRHNYPELKLITSGFPFPFPVPDLGATSPTAPSGAVADDLLKNQEKEWSGQPQGYYFEEPYYDPTNGSTSEGNLFIEIPPPEPGP